MSDTHNDTHKEPGKCNDTYAQVHTLTHIQNMKQAIKRYIQIQTQKT